MSQLTIALDAMGGDDAPEMVMEGVSLACGKVDAFFQIYGDAAQLRPLAKQFDIAEDCYTIIHTDNVVAGEDKPSQAVRRGRESSMGLAIQAVKDGEAHVALSAGNTGALMALSKILLRTMPGIDRPAIATPLPTLRGESLLLDLGANVECSKENLVQFAIMGAAYARVVFGIERPTVGLLNVGVEDLKGNESVKEAAKILKDAPLPMEFLGFTEGDGISKGEMDVIVTDGFTGNVALKAMEGTARLITTLLGDSFRSSILARMGYALASGGIRQLRNHLDPNNHNGGMFLGLNGIVVKSHGGANARGFASAIGVAANMARNDLNSLIMADLENFSGVDGGKVTDEVAANDPNGNGREEQTAAGGES